MWRFFNRTFGSMILPPRFLEVVLSGLKRISAIGCALASMLGPSICHAVSFGVFDARTLGLGNTSVAMADLGTGHLYNPALTALHRGDEDDTQDGRHSIPATIRYSDAAETAVQILQDDLEGSLSRAIDNFNLNPGAETALAGEQAAQDLKTAMIDIRDGGDIWSDIYLGYSVSEPGDREGGAFFIGSRVVANGIASIEEADIDLTDNYIEALRFIHTGGTEGVPHPELFLEDGQLADPADDILSSALARVAVLTEMGLSGAKMFPLWGQAFSFGIAAKATNLTLFDDQWQVVDGVFVSDGQDEEHWYFNMDVGVIWAPGDAWRIGLASKDLIPHSYTSALGFEFDFKPRTRLGAAYTQANWSVGMDIDLSVNSTLRQDVSTQEVSFGAEYQPLSFLTLRGGYVHDLEGAYEDKFSTGVGFQWRRLALDLTFASGSTDATYGIQLSIAH